MYTFIQFFVLRASKQGEFGNTFFQRSETHFLPTRRKVYRQVLHRSTVWWVQGTIAF